MEYRTWKKHFRLILWPWKNGQNTPLSIWPFFFVFYWNLSAFNQFIVLPRSQNRLLMLLFRLHFLLSTKAKGRINLDWRQWWLSSILSSAEPSWLIVKLIVGKVSLLSGHHSSQKVMYTSESIVELWNQWPFFIFHRSETASCSADLG